MGDCIVKVNEKALVELLRDKYNSSDNIEQREENVTSMNILRERSVISMIHVGLTKLITKPGRRRTV